MEPEFVRDLLCALSPVNFAHELGFTDLDPWQRRALGWGGKRLLLNVHRQGGKSTVAAILGLHEAVYRPVSLTLLVSPSLRQSVELFRKILDFIGKLRPPLKLVEDNRTSLTTETGSRIVSLPSSESTIRGYSAADLVIEDESARVHDDLHRAVRPMLAVSGGRLILMSTPAGKRGHFWEAWTGGDPVWERIEAKATECPRITPTFLAEEKRALGEAWFRQEYACEFTDPEGAIFSMDLLREALDPSVKPLSIRSRWREIVGGAR